jgi:hypothetical protein
MRNLKAKVLRIKASRFFILRPEGESIKDVTQSE